MGFSDFKSKVALRVILIGLAMAGFVALISDQAMLITAIILGLIIIGQLWELNRFISQTNTKLTRFLESIKYSDFVSGFSVDNKLGKSFKDLNRAFNEVMEAFRKARSEKEENWQYLNTVVEHVSTGLLSFDADGNVELINATAKRFLQVKQIRNIDELIEKKTRLYKEIFDLKPGKSTVYQLDSNTQLAIQATELRMRGRKIKLVALQNIQPELQKKEIEAWQNLTRVLRHEIMNSITPIASLTSTLKEILIEDLHQQDNQYTLENESVEDLQEGLNTIENRSKGLIKFVDAYRDYTSIPKPNFQKIRLRELLDHLSGLMKIELRKAQVDYKCGVEPEDIEIFADEELIEQVLINLVKNAIEATVDKAVRTVSVQGLKDQNDNVVITVRDNGQGIIPEAMEKVFIPFFSTKSNGSGIGLSLSRQIMQMHNGTLTVESEPEEYTQFCLKF
ncbi:MAG: ATP-binding protein [Bacteroidota bacterium]